MPKILDAVTVTGAGAVEKPSGDRTSGQMGVVQFLLTDATVKLEGSLDNSTFIDVSNDFTASGGERVALMPFLRANVTVLGSGSVSAWLEF